MAGRPLPSPLPRMATSNLATPLNADGDIDSRDIFFWDSNNCEEPGYAEEVVFYDRDIHADLCLTVRAVHKTFQGRGVLVLRASKNLSGSGAGSCSRKSG